MKLLLDTHYLLWLFIEPQKIPEKAKAALLSKKNEVYYSPVSLWEIAIKFSIGKLSLRGITPEEFYQEIENSFLLCKPISTRLLVSSYRLQREHKDPFDRFIVWQAIQEGMTLLSVDEKMERYVEHGLTLFET